MTKHDKTIQNQGIPLQKLLRRGLPCSVKDSPAGCIFRRLWMRIETYRSLWINGILMDWMRFEEGLVGLGMNFLGYHDDIMGFSRVMENIKTGWFTIFNIQHVDTWWYNVDIMEPTNQQYLTIRGLVRKWGTPKFAGRTWRWIGINGYFHGDLTYLTIKHADMMEYTPLNTLW